ncbi:hypothetical protein BSKO_01305 [Bryopsis sp. KO-2023]|nr:hypothetical protein BSKO_01305 [Bryopsis sp. KO-2023]
MDFAGQKLSERICVVLIMIGAVVSFGVGYVLADFSMMMKTYAGFVGVTFLLVGPDWPFYNRDPIKWREHPKEDGDGSPTSTDSKTRSGDAQKQEGESLRRRR